MNFDYCTKNLRTPADFEYIIILSLETHRILTMVVLKSVTINASCLTATSENHPRGKQAECCLKVLWGSRILKWFIHESDFFYWKSKRLISEETMFTTWSMKPNSLNLSNQLTQVFTRHINLKKHGKSWRDKYYQGQNPDYNRNLFERFWLNEIELWHFSRGRQVFIWNLYQYFQYN